MFQCVEGIWGSCANLSNWVLCSSGIENSTGRAPVNLLHDKLEEGTWYQEREEVWKGMGTKRAFWRIHGIEVVQFNPSH